MFADFIGRIIHSQHFTQIDSGVEWTLKNDFNSRVFQKKNSVSYRSGHPKIESHPFIISHFVSLTRFDVQICLYDLWFCCFRDDFQDFEINFWYNHGCKRFSLVTNSYSYDLFIAQAQYLPKGCVCRFCCWVLSPFHVQVVATPFKEATTDFCVSEGKFARKCLISFSDHRVVLSNPS